MAYDEGLAERIRGVLSESTDFAEKKMFGGLAFMVRGNMCLGVRKGKSFVSFQPVKQLHESASTTKVQRHESGI